jgi:hypothetical protein
VRHLLKKLEIGEEKMNALPAAINMQPAVDPKALYEILGVKQVANILGISVPCAYKLFSRKDFPSLPIADRNQKKVSRAALERWLLDGKLLPGKVVKSL